VSTSLKDDLKKKVTDPWAGTWSAIIVLIFVVLALIVLTTLRSNQAFFTASQQTATALATTTITPTPLGAEEAELIPPIIDTNVLVVLAGLILVLVLVVMLREVAWFRKHGKN
jgi:magnesium-transporting ATPase (P-type)